MLDLVIRHGTLVDGTGSRRRLADVGVRDGRIVALGDVDESAVRTIDADGAIVAPGFVDPHTHYDAQVFWDPGLTPSTLHGVTTVIAGNCGFSVAPLTDDSVDYVMRMLARVEGMPLAALQASVPWSWHSTAEYFDRVDGHVAANIGFLVGHSTIRRAIMGPAATERESTAPEREAMAALLREGLDAGGLGFSTSFTASHSDDTGAPVPSRFAAREELLGLAAICGEFDGTSVQLSPDTSSAVFSETTIELMVDLSVRSRRPLNWNVIRLTAGNPGDIERKLALADRASAAGGSIVGLAMPLHNRSRLNFASGYVFAMLPGWSEPMALPVSEKLELLANPSRRAELLAAASVAGPTPAWAQWEDYEIQEAFTDATRRREGQLVGDIAREERKTPFDALVDIVVADGLRTSIARRGSEETAADWEARGRVLRDPRLVVGGSDAGAHLDMTDTFTYHTRLLGEGVREHGVLTMEQAVHLLTEAPAALFGLRDRGVLREGAWADIVVFDEDTIGCGPLHTRHDVPDGSGRLFAESIGIEHVLVNGEPIVERGALTEQRPGRVVRSGRDTTSV
jgi:N-acyl-D-aspartate/D-glutamate deacylase